VIKKSASGWSSMGGCPGRAPHCTQQSGARKLEGERAGEDGKGSQWVLATSLWEE